MPSPDWLEVDITVVKTIENHPQQNNVSCPVEVGAALVSEVLNINELRQHSVPSPLKIVGSARLRFRTTSVSMRYRCAPS